MLAKNTYIEKLIELGENQRQDFKFEISDSKKIARTLSAFSNTDGGKLLIGVKDNGSITGIRSEEEKHMLEAAAQMYCKPEVPMEFTEWNINGKLVLEVDILKNHQHLISAPDKNGQYKVFIRLDDQNILANGIFIKNWEQRKSARKVEIKFTEMEWLFLQTIKKHESINFSKLRKILQISHAKLNQMILDFMMIEVVELKIIEKGYFYQLNDKQLLDYENTK